MAKSGPEDTFVDGITDVVDAQDVSKRAEVKIAMCRIKTLTTERLGACPPWLLG
jgi:hypothetical protein